MVAQFTASIVGAIALIGFAFMAFVFGILPACAVTFAIVGPIFTFIGIFIYERD